MYRHVFPAKLIFFGKSDWIVNSILPRDTTRQVIFPFLFFDPPIFEMGRNVASFLTTFLKTGKLFLPGNFAFLPLDPCKTCLDG